MILNQEFFPGTAVDGSPLTWEVFRKPCKEKKLVVKNGDLPWP